MGYRIDKGVKHSKPTRRADGSLVVDANITRPGVFAYLNPDGTIRYEWRPESEVHHPDSLASLRMVPVTNDHPEPGDPRDVKTWTRMGIGAVGTDVRVESDGIAATVAVHRADALALIDEGKRQLSAGYFVVEEMTSGVVPDGHVDAGMRYDLIQRQIRYDHVALVDAGRAGTARLRMDAAVMVTPNTAATSGKDRAMDEELKKALEAKAKAEARADAAESKIAKLEAERDAANDRASKAEKDAKERADAAPAIVEKRLALVSIVGPVLRDDKSIDLVKASDVAIKRAYIARVDGVTVPADKTPEYVDARFDFAVENATKSGASFALAATVVHDTRNDGGVDPLEKARADHDQRMRKLNSQPMNG